MVITIIEKGVVLRAVGKKCAEDAEGNAEEDVRRVVVLQNDLVSIAYK